MQLKKRLFINFNNFLFEVLFIYLNHIFNIKILLISCLIKIFSLYSKIIFLILLHHILIY